MTKKKEVKKLLDVAEMLWVVLANVSNGDWTKQTDEWQKAAKRWRDNYFRVISPFREHKTDGSHCWCNPKIVSYKPQKPEL